MASEPVPSWEKFYLGSRTFIFVANATGMGIDQVNFMLAQLAALLLAFIFRVLLHPGRVSSATRHWVSMTVGLILSYFCFGRQIVLAVILVVVCYALLVLLPPTVFHRVTLVASMLFLSAVHIQRQFYEDGIFIIDITGPLMIIVQKVTALAYSLHDGLTKRKEQMTPLQRKLVIRKQPTALEYFSYLLNFHSILAGPFFMFADYQDFIEGRQYMRYAVQCSSKWKKSMDNNNSSTIDTDAKGVVESHLKSEMFRSGAEADGNGVVENHLSASGEMEDSEPDPTVVALSKAVMSLCCAFVTVGVMPLFPITYIQDAGFLASSFMYKMTYLIFSTSLTRYMYYTGWILADSICNMSGLGFSGYDDSGASSWNLVSNVDVAKVEFGLSLKDVLDSWNIGTMRWLRFLVYERARFQPTVMTYLLSSLWHGFYPGYYLTFLSGAIFTVAARLVRRSIRPLILAAGVSAKAVYDVVTCLTTRVMLGYITFPFVLLRFWASLEVYKHLWFFGHIASVFVMAVLPVVLPPPKRAAAMDLHKHRN